VKRAALLAATAAIVAAVAAGACTGGSNGAPVITFDSLSPVACVADADTANGYDCAATLGVHASGGGTGTLVQGQLSAVAIGGVIDSSAETWTGAGPYSLPFHWSAPACVPGSLDLGVYAAVLMPTEGGSYAIGASVASTGYGDTRSCS